MIDASKREQVRKQAKDIMDKFARTLDSVKDKVEDSFIEREQDRRQEGVEKVTDFHFRKIMFENAPNKNRDFILGEKKKWE